MKKVSIFQLLPDLLTSVTQFECVCVAGVVHVRVCVVTGGAGRVPLTPDPHGDGQGEAGVHSGQSEPGQHRRQ